MRDPGVPWYAKVVAAAATGYVFSPIQLIPDWIPVIGCMDDLVVLSIALACMRRFTPRSVVVACHEHAKMAVAERAHGIHRRSLQIAAVVVLAIWFFVGALGTVMAIRALSGAH
ncbi:MAG: YkvA family protein [Ktedonobacterales bacterium]